MNKQKISNIKKKASHKCLTKDVEKGEFSQKIKNYWIFLYY